MLESTRNTITINHGENGTAEKTTVDTNPLKVLEHENLISDSEYITLNHQTGENTTHIQTAALNNVLQQIIQAISASGATSTINYYYTPDAKIKASKHDVTSGDNTLTTFSFDCRTQTAEQVITDELKEQLEAYVDVNETYSNSAITIKNDGTNIKLINSAPSGNVTQFATFTFLGGGGIGV